MNRCSYRLIIHIGLLLKYCFFCSLFAQAPTKRPAIKLGVSQQPASQQIQVPTQVAVPALSPKPASISASGELTAVPPATVATSDQKPKKAEPVTPPVVTTPPLPVVTKTLAAPKAVEVAKPENAPAVSRPSKIVTKPTVLKPKELTEVKVPPIAPIISPEADQAEEKVAETKEAEPSKIEDIYQEGIDTLDEGDIGNWYLKRAAWKKARPRYESIRKLVNQVEKLTREFINKKRGIDTKLDDFYSTVGSKQGEVIQILDTLIADLESENELKPQGLAEEQLKELVEVRIKKKRDLIILKANFEKIRAIVNNITEVILGTLQEQLATVHKYQEEALENYYKISEILNDKKAKELLEHMNNYSENIQAIVQWMKGPLNTYVNESIETLKSLMENVTKNVDELRSRGILLSIARSSEQATLKTEALEKEEQEKAEAEAKKKAAEQLPFFQKIFNWIGALFSKIITGISKFITTIYHRLLPSKTA